MSAFSRRRIMKMSRDFTKYSTKIFIIFSLIYMFVNTYFLLFTDDELEFSKSSRLPPFVDLYQVRFRFAPTYNISICLIPKSLSTVMTNLFCYLYDTEGFKKANRSISVDFYYDRFCANKNEKCDPNGKRECEPKDVKKMVMGSEKTLVIIRDPIERFVSGFVEKCLRSFGIGNPNICYYCGTDAKCFAKNQLARFRNISNGANFELTLADSHFAPQSWYCYMGEIFDKITFIKSQTGDKLPLMIDPIISILQQQNVPSNMLKEIRKELSKEKTIHSTKGTTLRIKTEKKIHSDPELMKLLIDMYYYDFLLFGYDIPKINSTAKSKS